MLFPVSIEDMSANFWRISEKTAQKRLLFYPMSAKERGARFQDMSAKKEFFFSFPYAFLLLASSFQTRSIFVHQPLFKFSISFICPPILFSSLCSFNPFCARRQFCYDWQKRVSHIHSQPKNLWPNWNDFSDWTVLSCGQESHSDWFTSSKKYARNMLFSLVLIVLPGTERG